MGRYNPHVPQILGQEWVGVQEQDVTFAPGTNIYDLGHGFTTASSYTLGDAKFYINTFPPGRSLGQVFLATIYQRGKEAIAGPVRSVIIPCNSALVSGGATGDADDVLDPSDNESITFPATGTPFVHFHFAVNSYSQLLNGKRILGVNFLYTLASSTSSGDATPPAESLWGTLSLEESSGGSVAIGLGAAEVQGSLVGISKLSTTRLGEVDHFWGGGAPNSSAERLPWRYQGLQDFEASAGSNRISVTYRHQTAAGWTGDISYAAIEVIFCDENRLYYGGKSFGESGFAAAHQPYVMGANSITMRDTTYTASPVLVAGNYSLVIASADLGDCAGPIGQLKRKINLSQYPNLNGLRQLYEIPTHPSIQVLHPFPIDPTAVDKTFTAETSVLLPQLSLHASGGSPLNEVHVYGRQARAQVYGSITATQEILDSVALGAASYPWVRYYARRFGDTTVPLRLDSPAITGTGLAVEITPSEFDDLSEIIDGWKEVTLRFDTAPTMGSGTNPQWRWSATGELSGNRWEVLGVIAPAVSGIVNNLLNQVPSGQRLGLATYGAPASGAGINLAWINGFAPLVSSTTDDPSSDAALIFSQDPPTVSGFSVVQESQPVVGIGLDCGLDPCCVPSEIFYNMISWSTAEEFGLLDTFTRVVASGWGDADSGQTWEVVNNVLTGANQITGFSVDGEEGLHSHSLANRTMSIRPDVSIELPISVFFRTRLPSGSGGYEELSMGLLGTTYIQVGIFTDGGYFVPFIFSDGSTSTRGLAKIAISTNWINIRVYISQDIIKMKAWEDGDDEPDDWTVTRATLVTITSADQLTFISATDNAPRVVQFDSISASSGLLGYYELQRSDTVETDWKTIMKATDATVSSFNDYEARIGISSSYRIRIVNLYDFYGPWSSTVSNTVSSPGVEIGCDDGHLLVFTSNEQQDGSINLAYSSVWEQGRTVEEGFTFPEAQFVQLQAMYNRDFFTAFRPTERGGEQFSRTVLVQAAAISPETLGDFTSLRDMAWADVSYICVRDEDGNRWFSTVLVPSGRVLRDRRLYLAPVEIVEVTDTPSEVDP